MSGRPLLALLAGVLSTCGVPVACAQGPPIHTDTPIMLGVSGRGVRTFVKIARLHGLLRNGEEVPDPMERTVTTTLVPFAVPYNLTATFQAGAIVPFVARSVDTVSGRTDRSGIGDVSVFAKHLLLQVDRKAETFRVALEGTVKLPTGDDGGDVPLGTGSVDFGLAAVAGWVKGRWGFYGEGLLAHNTSNDDVDYGDRLGFNVATGFRVVPGTYRRYPSRQLNVYLELNGTTTQRATAGGRENPDSGGTLVFLSPGVQYIGKRPWLVEGSAQLPLLDDPNGTQLATIWSTSVGVRVLIF